MDGRGHKAIQEGDDIPTLDYFFVMVISMERPTTKDPLCGIGHYIFSDTNIKHFGVMRCEPSQK